MVTSRHMALLLAVGVIIHSAESFNAAIQYSHPNHRSTVVRQSTTTTTTSSPIIRRHTTDSVELHQSSVNYLDSLSDADEGEGESNVKSSWKPGGSGSNFPAPPVPSPFPATTTSNPSSSSTTPSSSTTEPIVFHHAPLKYFDIDKLTPKGPRANADVGTPHDSTRPLVRGVGTSAVGGDNKHSVSAGSWWCAAGGWPSLSPRTTTEVFYVLSGYGCLTDMDGVRHYFGPGDLCILPKGWAGRWDIAEDIHKLWFVHDHENVEVVASESNPIRITVKHYHELVSSQFLSDPPQDVPNMLYDTTPTLSSHTLFDVGSTEVNSSVLTPGSFYVSPRSTTECFVVLEGTFVITNDEEGSDNDGSDDDDDDSLLKINNAKRCGPGDLVVLPTGWSGYWDVLQTVKKVSVVV